MAIFKGGKPRPEEEEKSDPRLGQAKDVYTGGRFKIVTLDAIPAREVLGTFGPSSTSSFATTLLTASSPGAEVNADAILGYRGKRCLPTRGRALLSCTARRHA
jgi:hypothetical protein